MTSKISAIQISHELLYVAFRAAWLSTFNTLACETACRKPESNGFLHYVPLLAGSAPQVQIDCLLQTWRRLQEKTSQLSALDQCVCYSATNELARLGEIEHRRRLADAAAGPHPLSEMDLLWLASKIRALQITFPVRSDALKDLSTSDFLNPNLDRSDPPSLFPDTRMQFLDVVGAWAVSPEILSNGADLLSETEIRMLDVLLQESPGMLNL